MNQTEPERERESKKGNKEKERQAASAAAAAEPLYIFYVIVACLCVKRRRERNYYTAIANYTLVLSLSLVRAPAFGARNRNGKEDALTRSSRALFLPPRKLCDAAPLLPSLSTFPIARDARGGVFGNGVVFLPRAVGGVRKRT